MCVCVCVLLLQFSYPNVMCLLWYIRCKCRTRQSIVAREYTVYWRSACARVPNACDVCVCVRRMCTKPLMANFPYELVDCAAIVVIVVIVNVVATGTDFFPIPNIDYSLGAHTQRIFILSSFSIVVIIRTSRLHYSSSSFFFYWKCIVDKSIMSAEHWAPWQPIRVLYCQQLAVPVRHRASAVPYDDDRRCWRCTQFHRASLSWKKNRPNRTRRTP